MTGNKPIKSPGRPRAKFDLAKAIELRGQGYSNVKIGKLLGVSESTVRSRFRAMSAQKKN